jgi:hypothetical protein
MRCLRQLTAARLLDQAVHRCQRLFLASLWSIQRYQIYARSEEADDFMKSVTVRLLSSAWEC